MTAFRRILHPTDFSRASTPAPRRAAGRARADLIVMGTHGRGSLDRALLGSVADLVIRLAPCPVVIVRETE